MHEPETHEPTPVGALEELARDPSSRKRFLKAAGGTGAASAFALFLAACGTKQAKTTPGGSNANTAAGTGTDQYGKGDLGIARYAVTLEYVESDFYAAVNKGGHLSGKAAQLFKRFGANENQHVQALEGAIRKLGGQPPQRPKPQNFTLGSPQSILTFALGLESLGASAYLGQVDRIQNKELLAAALSIHSVEARHASWIREINGAAPAPAAFDKPLSRNQVLAAVAGTRFIVAQRRPPRFTG
jgi:rubrerythrin